MNQNAQQNRLVYLVVLFLMCFAIQAQSKGQFYASTEEEHVLILEPTFNSEKTNNSFEKRYHYLVARAYFRLLSEAQKSERKLKAQYEKYISDEVSYDRKGNKIIKNKVVLAQKKYEAHRSMLIGLRSWNLFSEDRTADMLFFMKENEDRVLKMHKKELPEHKVVKYLIYRLADLYHLEEQ